MRRFAPLRVIERLTRRLKRIAAGSCWPLQAVSVFESSVGVLYGLVGLPAAPA
jgi:hypothetical protein